MDILTIVIAFFFIVYAVKVARPKEKRTQYFNTFILIMLTMALSRLL